MECTTLFLQTWAFPSTQPVAIAQIDTSPDMKAVTSHCHLLNLPIELRMMIWGILIPSPKALLAKKRDVTTEEDWENGISARTQFYLEHYSGKSNQQAPLLSKICRDSRDFLLGHGGFAFGKAGEGGVWWNSREDMLVIDFTWEDDDFVTQFDGMSGLQHVKNLALDTAQAGDLAYRVTYYFDDVGMPREERHPLAIDLTFRSHFRGWGPTDHFIPRLFTNLEHIMLYFPELNDPGCCRRTSGHTYSTEGGCRAHPTKLISEGAITRKVDIDLTLQGEDGMAAAVKSMTRCRHLWMGINHPDTDVPFHLGGNFYISHEWVRQEEGPFGNVEPEETTRHIITCEEMMEGDFMAL